MVLAVALVLAVPVQVLAAGQGEPNGRAVGQDPIVQTTKQDQKAERQASQPAPSGTPAPTASDRARERTVQRAQTPAPAAAPAVTPAQRARRAARRRTPTVRRGAAPVARRRARPQPVSRPAASTSHRATNRSAAAAERRKAVRHSTAGSASPLQPAKPKDDGGAAKLVTGTVRDIVHVVPGWAQALIGALAALLAAAGLLILLASLRNRRLRVLSRTLLDEVGTLSTALMPRVPGELGGLQVSVAYRPAAGLAAGGDFYDVFPLDRGRVGIVVGDVSGHGRESLGPATFTRHMVRSYVEAGLSPRAALSIAGRVMSEHDREEFATVIAAIHDPLAGTLTYACAGHPPPIVTGPGQHAPLTLASAPPLGVDATGSRQTTIGVGQGSVVCFFTDGLVEARTANGLLGRERVERIVSTLSPHEGAERVVARVATESDEIRDDVAVCLVRVEAGPPTASALRVEEVEFTLDELQTELPRAFLSACGVPPGDVEDGLHAARTRALEFGSGTLRVRIAHEGSDVDVLAPEPAVIGTPLFAGDAYPPEWLSKP